MYNNVGFTGRKIRRLLFRKRNHDLKVTSNQEVFAANPLPWSASWGGKREIQPSLTVVRATLYEELLYTVYSLTQSALTPPSVFVGWITNTLTAPLHYNILILYSVVTFPSLFVSSFFSEYPCVVYWRNTYDSYEFFEN